MISEMALHILGCLLVAWRLVEEIAMASQIDGHPERVLPIPRAMEAWDVQPMSK